MSNSSSKLSVNCDGVQHRRPPSGASGKSKPFSSGQCGRTYKPKEYSAYGHNALSATNLIILPWCVEVKIFSTKLTTTYNEKGLCC